MEEQSKFLEMLEDLKEVARAQGNLLTKEELKQYLGELELSEDQWKAVYQYMGAYQIRIQGYEYVPEDGKQAAKNSSLAAKMAADQREEKRIRESEEREKHPVKAKRPSMHEGKSRIQEHYRKDLRNLSSGSRSVPVQEIQRFLKGDMDCREQIAMSRLHQVVEIAERYAKYPLPLEELIAEGNLGLLNGMAKAETERERFIWPDGTADIQAFLKLLEQEVIGAIEQLINQETELKGQETAMLAKTNLLHESAKYLTEENGKIPTVQELSDYTRVPAEEIRQIMELSEDAKRIST